MSNPPPVSLPRVCLLPPVSLPRVCLLPPVSLPRVCLLPPVSQPRLRCSCVEVGCFCHHHVCVVASSCVRLPHSCWGARPHCRYSFLCLNLLPHPPPLPFAECSYFGDLATAWYVIVICGIVVAVMFAFAWMILLKLFTGLLVRRHGGGCGGGGATHHPEHWMWGSGSGSAWRPRTCLPSHLRDIVVACAACHVRAALHIRIASCSPLLQSNDSLHLSLCL